MTKRVLVVEDEDVIRENMVTYLTDNGYDVVEAADGPEAVKMFRTTSPHLVLLDLMLPGMDGIEVCKEIRKTDFTPIIMVTALGEEKDKLVGLEIGADDYMTKPFSLREMHARVRAVFRRSHQPAENSEDVREFGPLSINVSRREVRVNGNPVDLTPSEYSILLTLLENVGRPYTRLQLLSSTLGETCVGYERAIDTHVSNLRKKIEPNPQKPIFILTVYGLGYKFGDYYETFN